MLVQTSHFVRNRFTFTFVSAKESIFLNSETLDVPNDFETIGDLDLSPYIEPNNQEIENLNGFDNLDMFNAFDPSPFADGDYQEIVPVSDPLDSFIDDDTISSQLTLHLHASTT